MSHVLREHSIGMLTAGMSTRAVAIKLIVHFSPIIRLQLHFTDASLNAQKYRNEILRPIVAPFTRHHNLVFQHDNARPHVARICTQFLEAENVPVLP